MPNPQARDEDKNMEDRQNTSSGGHQGERHRRSPSHERLSRSPNQSRRSQRRDRPSADHEAIPWTHELMSGAILHDIDDCSTCSGYFSHFHKAYRQKLPSMEDALDEHAALTVPIQEHKGSLPSLRNILRTNVRCLMKLIVSRWYLMTSSVRYEN